MFKNIEKQGVTNLYLCGMEPKLPIAFKRDKDPINFLITLFSIIQRHEWNIYVTTQGNKVKIGLKNPEEINKLGLDMGALQARFAMWQISGEPVIYYTEEESDTLRKAIHAAYYFITDDDSTKVQYTPFTNYYEHLRQLKAL